MADSETQAPAEPKDPIVDRSLAPHFVVTMAFLLATVGWLVHDETVVRRPYVDIQEEFVHAAEVKAYAEVAFWREKLAEEKATDAYKAAAEALAEAKRAMADDAAQIEKLKARRTAIEGELNDVRGKYQALRGDYQPHVYNWEQANLHGDKPTADREWKAIKDAEGPINEVFQKFLALTQEKVDVQKELDEYEQAIGDANKAVALAAPSQQKMAMAMATFEKFPWEVDIQQLYNEDLGVVDRCQSCHTATDRLGFEADFWEMSRDNIEQFVGKGKTDYAKRVWATHPNLGTTDPSAFDAFADHPIDKYGCVICHEGNGPGTVADKAHGLDGPPRKSWLKPRHLELHPMLATSSTHFGRMFEGACAKCHDQQLYVKGAEQLTLGRELLEDVGCVGCHKVKGFRLEEQEQEDLANSLAKELRPRLATLKAALETAEDTAPIKREILDVGSKAKIAERRLAELDGEYKFIGPDLDRADTPGRPAGLRSKIYARWLPRWIANPHEYRPGTRMPNALLAKHAEPSKDEVVQVAAYIWQQAKGTPTAAEEPPAFSAEVVREGRWLAMTVGCVACHSLEEQVGGYDDVEKLRPAELDATPAHNQVYDMGIFWASGDGILKTKDNHVKPDRPSYARRGSTFGPALGRIGEKVRYEWLVAWLQDPKSLQPHSSMPSLRLAKDEAEKIAAFLTTLRRTAPGGDGDYQRFDTALLDDPKLAARGYRHIVRYGCYNCHQIDLRLPPVAESDLASKPVPPLAQWPASPASGKIGIELSAHGSKPLAQFDFGLHHHDVPHFQPAWYETKILEPRYWDAGKYKGSPNERLIMPRFGLNRDEARAITTVLVGLIEGTVPGQYLYRPGPRGQAITKGERILKKYNCRSCHVIDGRGGFGHEGIEAYVKKALQDSDLTAKYIEGTPLASAQYLPPPLGGQGTRTRPEWLFHFLKDPGSVDAGMAETRGKLRPFHRLRMPTFELTDNEAQALVDYFNGLENDLDPYPTNPEPDAALAEAGRALITKNDCLKCHSVGEWRSEQLVGPNFALLRSRNRMDWFHQFLADPQTYVPGSQMLSFWGDTPYFALDANAQREVASVAAYVRRLADPEFRRAEGYVKGGRPRPMPPKPAGPGPQ